MHYRKSLPDDLSQSRMCRICQHWRFSDGCNDMKAYDESLESGQRVRLVRRGGKDFIGFVPNLHRVYKNTDCKQFVLEEGYAQKPVV